MDEAYVFYPLRRRGAFFLTGTILIVLLFNVWNLAQIALSPININLLANLLFVLLAPVPLPWLIYRWRALQRAEYLIARDGIRLSWGLRLEDIPIQNVLWIRPQSEDAAELLLPRLRVPGALLGMGGRRLPDGSRAEIPLEFLASGRENLILLATAQRVYAVSPADPAAFLDTFNEMAQYGSLNPIAAQSIYPSFWSRRALRSPAMRILLVAGLAMNLILVTATALGVQAHSAIRLAPPSIYRPVDMLPAENLWILPFINFMLFSVEWTGGFFLYREEKNRPIAYLLWGASLFVSLLSLLGLYFILQTAR